MKSFHYGATSGVIAALAASATLSANNVFAWRKPLNLPLQYIQRVRVKAVPVVQATGGTFHLEIRKLLAMTANFATGTDTSDPATPANYNILATTYDRSHIRIVDQIPVSLLAAGNVKIASTAAITSAGSPTSVAMQLSNILGRVAVADLATGVVPPLEMEWTPTTSRLHFQDPVNECAPLLDDEGFVIRSALGTGGASFTISVEVDWLEQ